MYIPYVVQPGDSLYFIARMFGTTVEAIMAANRLTNPAMIFVGQVLYIPIGQPTQPPVQPPGTFPYVVQPGDTLYFIAQRFGTTVERLMTLNGINNPDLIYPGQVIFVPVVAPTTMPPTTMPPTTMPPTTMPPTTCPAGSFAYTIRSGDTFFLLAQRFGTTAAAIAALNPGVNPNNLAVGQVICIPSAKICMEFTFAYTIRSGDTLFSIARRFGTTVEALVFLNPEVDPNNLQVGQVICVPEANPTIPPTTMPPTTMPPATCPDESFPIVLQPGDTLSQLAQRIGSTVEILLQLNPGLNPNNVPPGTTICLPNPSTPPTIMPPKTCPVGSFAYTIQAGDTLFLLAQRFGVPSESIDALNPGVNWANLRIGQIICIPQMPPTTMPPKTCPVGSFAYTIRAGDTFYTLGQRLGASVTAIQALNPTVDPLNLQIGQMICIPNPVQCPVGTFPYVIKSGDTFYNLARQFGTTVEAIQALNPGLDPLNLQIGQTICIPKLTPTIIPPTTMPPTTMPPTTMPPATCPMGSFAYRIRAGDTFPLLAQRFDTTVAAIQVLNPNVNPDNPPVGQIICLPNAEGSLPPGVCPAGSFVYTVQIGDTYPLLAERFNITVTALEDLNPNVDPSLLAAGMKICIPGAFRGEEDINPGRDDGQDQAIEMLAQPVDETPNDPVTEAVRQCPMGSLAYTIQAGDTFFALAQQHGVTPEQIQLLNPTVDPNNLQVGQIICIPRMTPTTVPPTTMPPVTCPMGSLAYTIKAGDNFYALAIRFGTTAEAIQALNPAANPFDLKVGQMICIPQGRPTTMPPTTMPPGSCPTGTFAYTVRAGDTFFLLARRFGTTVEAIQAANPGVDPNSLKIGAILCIPGVPAPTTPPTTQPPATFRYVVQVGDTLFFIARRFGTTVDAILKLNPQITDPSALFPGQVILIPQPART